MCDNGQEIREISVNDMDHIPSSGGIKENLRVQRTEYIRQQMRRRREAEDALMVQLIEEQKVIGSLQSKIDEELEQTGEIEKYNREFKDSMTEQIYSMHGVSKDKLEGMEEYKDAYRRGGAFSLFLLSVVLIILCGVLHGFGSGICLFMLAFTGIEGVLLAQEKSGVKILNFVCQILYFLILPIMLTMFVCYELGYREYGLFLPYAVVTGTVILAIGALSYFLHDPYRSAKKKVREAKSHIAGIERTARKRVAKSKKISLGEEKKAQNQAEKETRRQMRIEQNDKNKEAVKSFFANMGGRITAKFRPQKALEERNFETDIVIAEPDADENNQNRESDGERENET